MSKLKLFLLGAPRIERDGEPLDLHYRKNMALIAYLATTGQRHTREALITLLWPDVEPSRARANLRRDLSMLRKALGGAWLVADRETVELERGASLWLDVDRFHDLVATWQEHGHSQTDICPRCLDDLADAVELYRGDLLTGFSLRDSVSFDDWQSFETEALRLELTSALEYLVRGHSAQGAVRIGHPLRPALAGPRSPERSRALPPDAVVCPDRPACHRSAPVPGMCAGSRSRTGPPALQRNHVPLRAHPRAARWPSGVSPTPSLTQAQPAGPDHLFHRA
jgi:hypothetical protein